MNTVNLEAKEKYFHKYDTTDVLCNFDVIFLT